MPGRQLRLFERRPWEKYLPLQNLIEAGTSSKTKPRYSVTADILAYQRCKRQYGFFAVRRYSPAHIVQLWYGLVIHQVLDKLHLHWLGLMDPSTREQLPTDADVDRYFEQVLNSLKARGIKPINDHVKESAKNVLRISNRIEGPELYPNVLNTEYRLQKDKGDYIIHGIVDLLKGLDEDVPRGYDRVEIWDYKGSKFPQWKDPITGKVDKAKKLLFSYYKFQMLVYAGLYKEKTGKYPLKGIIYFMNELNKVPEPTRRPSQAVYSVDFRDPENLEQIEHAMEVFDETVRQIERDKELDRWEPPMEPPDKETCDICDLRWSCPVAQMKYGYPMRYP